MKIWDLVLRADEKIGLENEEIYEYIGELFKGEPITNKWEKLKMYSYYKDPKNETYDILNFDGRPVFTVRFYNLLTDEIRNHIEALDVEHIEYGNLKAINVLTVLDCLDEEASEFRFFGKFRKIEKHVFKKRFTYPAIFKIKTDNCIGCYVSDVFKDVVEKNDIKGVKFNLVWDDYILG